MVLLRNIISLVLIVTSLGLHAQNKKELEKALVKSYSLESEYKYAAAASALFSNYLEDNYIVNLRLAWLYYNAGEHEKSVRFYTKAIELLPYAIEPKLGLTLPLSALNKWDEVLKEYNAIIAIDDKNSTALYNSALILYNRENYAEAYLRFKELNNLYPTDYNASHMHGWAALKTGKIREATVIFNNLLLLYPEDASAQSALELLK